MTGPDATGLYHVQADTIDDGDRTMIVGAATAEAALEVWVAEHIVPECPSAEWIEAELGWFATLRVRKIPALAPGESLDWGDDAEIEDTDTARDRAAVIASSLIADRDAEVVS